MRTFRPLQQRPHCTAALRSSAPQHKFGTSPTRVRAFPAFPDKMISDEDKKLVVDSIRGIPDFPHKGILFWDVTTLLLNHAAFQATVDAFAARYKDQKIDVVAGATPMHMCIGLLLLASTPGFAD